MSFSLENTWDILALLRPLEVFFYVGVLIIVMIFKYFLIFLLGSERGRQSNWDLSLWR